MNKRMKQICKSIFYELTSEEKVSYEGFIRRKIEREREKHPLFYRMLQIINKREHIYLSDFLVEDYNAFTLNLGESSRFVWNVYNCGTRLVRIDNDFEEQMISNWEYFQLLKGHYFGEDTLTYIVDVKRNELKKVDPSKLNETDFSNRYGKIVEYFNNQMKDCDNSTYFEKKDSFKELMEEFKNMPPKNKIDNIINKQNSKKAV